MKSTDIKGKDGKILKTKEDVVLKDNVLEIGDSFIMVNNTIRSRKTTEFYNYSITAKVKDKNGLVLKVNDLEEIFLKITPMQAQSLINKQKEGIELNQHLFIVYEYISQEHGKQIGFGVKRTFNKSKDFKDFE